MPDVEYIARLQVKIDRAQLVLDNQTDPDRIATMTAKRDSLIQKKTTEEAS